MNKKPTMVIVGVLGLVVVIIAATILMRLRKSQDTAVENTTPAAVSSAVPAEAATPDASAPAAAASPEAAATPQVSGTADQAAGAAGIPANTGTIVEPSPMASAPAGH